MKRPPSPLPLQRIALAGAPVIALVIFLANAALWYRLGRAPLPLPLVLWDAASLALLGAGILYPFCRRLARETKGAQESLRKTFTVSSSAVCIWRLDDGTLFWMNDAFLALTGYSTEEILDKKARELDLCRKPAQFQRLVRKLKEDGRVQDFEVDLISRRGEAIAGLVNATEVEFQGVTGILAIIRDLSQIKIAQQTIEKLSYYDKGSGLPNQNLLMDRLNQIISLNGRENRTTALIYVGMDGFKGIMDALGQAGSDAILRDIGQRLAKVLRQSDTVARLHRDELGIVLGGELREQDLDLVLAKIEQVFALPIKVPTGELTVAAYFGIACFPADGLSGEILLQHSHAAMNQARKRRESFQYFSTSMNVKAIERLKIESSMMRSLEDGEFFLCYQPKYAWNGTDLTGMEALLRWNRGGEMIPPANFIPVAEENGMIVKLGEWVLREACRQNRSWQEEGLSPLQVSVNISARQLRENDFAEKVVEILKETGLEPQSLELEITESAIMSLSDDILLKLLRLKELGVSISIDDFGTGYSSLSYLKHLPIDKIKIDRSFVLDIVNDSDDAAIVDAVISIAHALNLRVIAEGVESKGQLDFLVGRNCTEFQGYYFSRPLGAENFGNLLRGATVDAGGNREAPGKRARDQQHSLRLAPPPRADQAGEPSERMEDVAVLIQPVAPQDRIINVLSRFQLEKGLTVLPVVENGVIVGMVNRSTFLEEHIIGRYGFAAHINHPKKIKELMDPVELCFDAGTRVEEAAALLQPRLATLKIDNICITKNGTYAGVIDVNRFIKAMTELRITLAKGANPLTGLPGNSSIEREICRRLDADVPFDIAYIDIDNFKPFNDHYGFQKGDEVIRKVAEIMTDTVAAHAEEENFCGHIGGDDFILITESLRGEAYALRIASLFEGERRSFHGGQDFEAGGYQALNRKGEPESFPLISLSIGIVNTSLSQVSSYSKLASLSTEVKKAAKMRRGSSIVVDRRAG